MWCVIKIILTAGVITHQLFITEAIYKLVVKICYISMLPKLATKHNFQQVEALPHYSAKVHRFLDGKVCQAQFQSACHFDFQIWPLLILLRRCVADKKYQSEPVYGQLQKDATSAAGSLDAHKSYVCNICFQ